MGACDTPTNPVYSTTRPDDDLWCATIDFDILGDQGRKGLLRFKDRKGKIQRDVANKKITMDLKLAAVVALQRLDGDSDERSSDEYDDEHFE